MAIKIDRIDAGSDAEALGLQPGDELLSVDENELNDTLEIGRASCRERV